MTSFQNGLKSAFVLLLATLASEAASADEQACDPRSVGVVCQCDLTKLSPLQGAVGLAEVTNKADKLRDKLRKETAKNAPDPWSAALDDLRCDPIKVVVGPDGNFYITDHHHGALAWWIVESESKQPRIGLCMIQAVKTRDTGEPVPFVTMGDFWAALGRPDVGLVRLRDNHGVAILHDNLPKSVGALKYLDDPYRSLAWKVRKAKGFCRPKGHPEFVEFDWADYFRTDQKNLPEDKVLKISPDKKADKDLVDAGANLAKLPAAKDLPGFGNIDCEAEEQACVGGGD
jgi:hypothetical protein